jgi:hypothetical protein
LVAAEKFCVREGLHRGYIDEVTKWLRKQSSGQATLQQTPSNTTTTQSKPAAKNQIYQSEKIKFPKINYIKFDSVNIDGPLKKIIEFNATFDKSAPFYLTEIEVKAIKTMLETIKNSQFYHTSMFSEPEINIMHKKLGYFPEENIIPYLDIFRMFFLHPRSQDMFKKMGGGFAEYARLTELLKNTSYENVRVLCLRVISNMFMHEATRNLLSAKRSEIFDVLANFIDNENKLVKGSLISVFFK